MISWASTPSKNAVDKSTLGKAQTQKRTLCTEEGEYMMFLKQVPGPKPPEESKRKAYLQKRRKTQHLEKAYPPPRINFSSEKHTQSSTNPPLTCGIQPLLELLITHISPLNPSDTSPINNLQAMFFSNWRTKKQHLFFKTHAFPPSSQYIFSRMCF